MFEDLKDEKNLEKMMQECKIGYKLKFKKAFNKIKDESYRMKSSIYEMYAYGLSKNIIKKLRNSNIITMEKILSFSDEKLKKYLIQDYESYSNTEFKKIRNAIMRYKKDERVYIEHKLYVLEKVTFEEAINNVNDKKSIEILKRRLNGETLEQIGKDINLTREGVRQRIKRIVKTIKFTNSRELSYIARKYNWNVEDYCYVFQVSPQLYKFLLLKYGPIYSEGSRFNDISEFFKTELLDEDQKTRLINRIYKK